MGKQPLHGNQRFRFQPVFLRKMLQLAEGTRLFHRKTAHTRALSGFSSLAAAELLPDIMTERPDVGTLEHSTRKVISGSSVSRIQMEKICTGLACLSTSLPALASSYSFFPFTLSAGIHGRDLLISPKEGKHCSLRLLFIHRHLVLLKDGSGQILGYPSPFPEAEPPHTPLSLPQAGHTASLPFPRHTGSTPTASGSRVPVWPIFFWPQYAAQLRHHIMGGKARFLIYIQHAVLHHFLLRRPAVFLYVRNTRSRVRHARFPSSCSRPRGHGRLRQSRKRWPPRPPFRWSAG